MTDAGPAEFSAGPPPERDDTEDHDLLTYGEVGVRLHEEMVAQREQVRTAERSGDAQAVEAARARLALLEEAASRNARQPINDENFEAFFGFRGAARRNT